MQRIDLDECRAYLGRPGAVGGLGCCAELPEEPQQRAQEVAHEHLLAAQRDLAGMKRVMGHMKFRKSSPYWTAPAAVWRLLLRTTLQAVPRRRTGSGYDLGTEAVSAQDDAIVRHRIVGFLSKVRAQKRVPLLWSCSWA